MRFPFTLTTAKEFDCVGFGLNAVDHLIVAPRYPAFDTKTRLTHHVQAAGGQTANAMVGLQRLGMRTAYAGRFGSDQPGQFGFTELEREGVDVSSAEIIEGARNQIAFIVIDERTGERTILWDRDERLAYRPNEAPIEFARRGRVLHIDAHDPPACMRMTRSAREIGAIVSADIDNLYDGLLDLLPFIDVLVSSKEFPHRLTGISDEHASLIETHARYGCAIVGTTLGIRGALIYCNGSFIESPAFEVPGGCKDTTGAGDAFHVGLIYGMLTGEDVETSLRMANAVGALKCRAIGGRTSLPTLQEVNEIIRMDEV